MTTCPRRVSGTCFASRLGMVRCAALLTLCLMAASAGCGGIVERSSRDPEPGDGEPSQSGSEPDSPGAVPGESDTELGECKLGPKESFDVPCAWVAQGRCYSTREMACNCVCPRSRDSQCISGFAAGQDGHVGVSCI